MQADIVQAKGILKAMSVMHKDSGNIKTKKRTLSWYDIDT